MSQVRFEELLHEWLLEEAPSEAPDWLLEQVEAQVGDVAQERSGVWSAWRLAALGAAVFAGLVMAVGLYALRGAPAGEPTPELTDVRWTNPVGTPRVRDLAVIGNEIWITVSGGVIRLDGEAGHVLGELRLGDPRSPELAGWLHFDQIIAAFGSMWVVSPGLDTVTRVDPGSLQPLEEIEVGPLPGAVAAGPDAIWILAADLENLWRLDPTSGQATGTLHLALGHPSYAGERNHISVAPDAVWMSIHDQVVRVDPVSLELVAAIPVGGEAAGLTVLDSVWVAVPGRGALVEIDPETNSVIGAVPAGSGPYAVTAAHGLVWVADRRDGLVRAVDPASGEMVAALEVGRGAIAIDVSGASVWVLNQIDGTVSHIRIGTDLRSPD